MAMTEKAHAGETLDALVWRVLGQGAEAVEDVLAVNPGLTELGALLPEGTPVLIPDIAAAPAEVDLVQLWD